MIPLPLGDWYGMKSLESIGKFVNIGFQKRLTDEDTWGGVHPERRGIMNVRKYASALLREWGPFLR